MFHELEQSCKVSLLPSSLQVTLRQSGVAVCLLQYFAGRVLESSLMTGSEKKDKFIYERLKDLFLIL